MNTSKLQHTLACLNKISSLPINGKFQYNKCPYIPGSPGPEYVYLAPQSPCLYDWLMQKVSHIDSSSSGGPSVGHLRELTGSAQPDAASALSVALQEHGD